MRVICIGHSTYDITLPMNEFPVENIKYRLDKHIECGGGPAGNGAYLLAKWGMNVFIGSIIGNDFYGDKVTEEFKNIGVNIKYLEKLDNHKTSSSYIIANMKNGSRTILTSKDKMIRKLSKDIEEDADLILVDGEHIDTALDILDKNPTAVSVLDAGRINEDTKLLGKKVTYLICSKEFAEEFCNMKITRIDEQFELMNIHKNLEEYFNTNIIITLEANGSFTKIDGEYKLISSVKVTALDSTGAGDIFHGAFVYFIGNNYSLYDSIKYASIAGAISVTRIGSRFSIPDLKEVLEYDDVI